MTKIDDQAGEPAELATGWSVTRLLAVSAGFWGEEAGDPLPEGGGVQAVRGGVFGWGSVAAQLGAGDAEIEQAVRQVGERPAELGSGGPGQVRLDQDHIGGPGCGYGRVQGAQG